METYTGHVRTPADAIILFEACRIGLLPRVQRRLSEKERQSIQSGSVFVWDEREAGMRRWTDGKSWSASRVSGSFLTYREMEGKRGNAFDKSHSSRDSMGGGDMESDGGPDGYRYKADGLIKQSFSITTNSGQHLHLISYYSRSAGQAHSLKQPTNDPSLRHIRPEKGMYPESTVHEQSSIPAVTRGPMNSPQYTQSPHHPAFAGAAPYPYPGHASWAPPSPMHTPPPNYAPYGYQGHHPPPAGYPHTSPLQHVQYPPHTNYPPPPGQTAFDRPPPHLQNTSLPPPPPPPPPQYPPQSSYPGPYHHYPHEQAHYQGSGPYHHYPPPPTTQPQQPYHTAPKYPHPAESNVADRQREPASRTPPDLKRERSPARLPPPTTAQTIPSISSMLNGGDAPPLHRSNSGSPGSGPLRGPSDIPSHKLGFEANRDMEALRNLDKTTFKGYR